MFLEKLEIQGFKSFATKNILVFPGMIGKTKRGITAIVGPNGSGKSNVADGVRWALGEQSMKTLRGKKSEDIIFSGSDKKGRLGMSEVSLFLNNEEPLGGEAGKKAPVDYSEIVITRRLFRNGDSEYVINNNRVRLLDIQMLLAKASFGQKTYSVIGQGMVEGFLNTSLSERKEFFDEATGVKQFQIKRDDSLNKLRSSYENLIQAQMLLTEIEPRLRSLTRQVNKLKKRGEIEGELKGLQLKYYSSLWHEINDKFKEANTKFLELEQTKLGRDRKLDSINREMEKLKTEGGKNEKHEKWQAELLEIQETRENINKKLARLEAQMEVKLEANGQFDTAYLVNREKELKEEKENIASEIESLTGNIGSDKQRDKELNRERERIEKKIVELNNNINKTEAIANQEDFRELNKKIDKALGKTRQAEGEADVSRIKSILKEIKHELKEILQRTSRFLRVNKGGSNGKSREDMVKALNDLMKGKEDLFYKINDNNLRITARSERVRLLRERKEELKRETETVSEKLRLSSGGIPADESMKEKEKLESELKTVEERNLKLQERINQVNTAERQERDKLFSLQRDIQTLQNEINILSNQLGELKINSTRYETKLEDLEIEIREELGELKAVRENKTVGEIDIESIKDQISASKRQLELIGGIDPAIEKEYTETKERYDFLFGQSTDLEKAVDSLEKIIKELDINIKERFDKEFKIIEKKFSEYFKVLFNGGSAKIIKVMDSSEEMKLEKSEEGEEEEGASKKDKMEIADIKKIKFLQKHNATGLAGIEIQATPPGKKIKSISMLSGGERALTAIALICAIISANPSPFVVLDEVDAALDEANSERLAKILDELSHKTQFIVITHNRATMRRANVLYGVTMGDDGVSKLLSIKLDDAKAVVDNK